MKKIKLNIQLFASNSNSTSIYAPVSSTYPYTLSVSWNETATSTSGNNSTISISGSLYGKNISYSTTTNHTLAIYWYDDNSYGNGTLVASINVPSLSKGGTASVSGSITPTHKNDGTLNGYARVVFTKNSSNSYVPATSGLNTANTALTKIARYFSSTPSISFKSKTETSITYTWSTSEWCSGLTWNGGGTLTNFSAGTSGTITITGLSANSSYTHYGTFKRSDSGLTTNSGSLTNSTYDYPKITTVNSTALNIGNQQTLTISNPLGRTYKIYMYKDSTSGTKLYESSNLTTNGNVNFTPTASTLYASIPSAKSGKCVYRVTYGSVNKDTTGSYTFNCVESSCKPTINSTTATDTTNQTLTGSSSKLIVNLSKPAVSMSASAKNSASISSYKIVCGSQTINSSSGTFSSSITTNKITYSVTDSRGYTTTTDVTPTSVTYVPVTVSPTFVRNQPTDGKVNLSYSGNFFNASFGSVANTFEVKWRVKQSGGSYGSWTTLSPTKSGNTYTQNVGTLSGTYDYTKDYVFNIVAIDKINTNGYSVEVNVIKGQPVFWWNSEGLHTPTKLISDGTKMTISTSGMPTSQSKGTTAVYRDGVAFYAGGNTSGNDGGFIRFNEDTTNSGYMEICTGDDGAEPIYARQYNGNGVARTASILDGSGNTSFPGRMTSVYTRGSTRVEIPKSGTAGYGLCNTDGSSIIRDHGNKNVTVDATGATLFLGYQNTTGLNFMNGKASMDSNGILSTPNIGRIGHYLSIHCTRHSQTLSSDWAEAKITSMQKTRSNGDTLVLDDNGIKAARACKVMVVANATISTASSGDGQISIRHNSTTVGGNYSSDDGGWRMFSGSAIVTMAAGDHIYLYFQFGAKGSKEMLSNTGLDAIVLNT